MPNSRPGDPSVNDLHAVPVRGRARRAVAAFGTAVLLSSAVLVSPPPASAAEPLTGKIAWGQADQAGGWDTEIWVANADGSNAQQLTHDSVDEGSATWSPDGSQIAFHRFVPETGGQDVYVMDADGSNVRLVFSSDFDQMWLSDWHGTTLLAHRQDSYVVETRTDREIVAIDVNTGVLTLLTDDTGTAQSWPVFSPDGTQIAYSQSVQTSPGTCTPDGCTSGTFESDLYVMDVASGASTQATFTPFEDEMYPAWSASGLAYSSRRDEGNLDIYVTTTGGTELRLTTDPADDDRPMWSPNGEVGFTRDGPMWVMNADGSDQRSLGLGSEYVDAPDWTDGTVAPQQPHETTSTSITSADGGTITTDEGDGATEDDPVETTITAPCCGSVTIEESWATDQPPAGYFFFGQEVYISASIDPTPTADAPMSFSFVIDGSAIPPETDYGAVQVFRNGVAVENCTDAWDDAPATPDPCVYARDFNWDSNDLTISVYTTAASAWNLGLSDSGGPGGGGNTPQISVSSPAEYMDEQPNGEVSSTEGGVYVLNSAQTLSFSCWDDDGDLSACEAAYEDGTPAFDGEPLDTSRIGERQISFYAADHSGQTEYATVTYRVIYAFDGFRQPVDNPLADGTPVLNKVKSGASVPIKFSLGGDQGLAIFDAGSPSVAQISCTPAASVDQIEQTVTSSAGSLTYNVEGDLYTYTLKTPKAWAGTCQELSVRLVDGTVHRAQFKGS